MELSEIKVLSDDEVKKIDNASMEILSEIGVKIKSRNILLILEEKGLDVDYDSYIVKFDPVIVRKAIKDTPEEIEIFSRDRSYSFKLGTGNETRTASGAAGVFTYNYKEHSRKPTTKKEVGIYAKLSHYLSDIDLVFPECTPQDVPSESTILHGVDAVLNNTTKPIMFSTEKDVEVEAIIEMLKIVMDSEKINVKPIGICEISPSSPLNWIPETINGFINVAKEGFPCLILPGPLSGATAPYSICGTVIQKNCEILSGVVIAQLFNKGTPLLYYSGAGVIDMKTGIALLGTPESYLVNIASTQIARYYKIPTHNCTPCSDANNLDEQLGFDNMLSYISGFLSNTDLLVNAGMFSTGETTSFEQLIIDNEMINMVRRYIRGIEVNKESMTLDSIKRIGPGGSYLADELTIKNLRSTEFSQGNILVRKKYERWLKDGGKSIVENAEKEIKRILKNEEDVSLEENKREKIGRVISNYENKYK